MTNLMIAFAIVGLVLVFPFAILSYRTGFSKRETDTARKKYFVAFIIVSFFLLLFNFLTFLYSGVESLAHSGGMLFVLAFYEPIRYTIPVCAFIAITIYRYRGKIRKVENAELEQKDSGETAMDDKE